MFCGRNYSDTLANYRVLAEPYSSISSQLLLQFLIAAPPLLFLPRRRESKLSCFRLDFRLELIQIQSFFIDRADGLLRNSRMLGITLMYFVYGMDNLRLK